jgi:hypothetical protein
MTFDLRSGRLKSLGKIWSYGRKSYSSQASPSKRLRHEAGPWGWYEAENASVALGLVVLSDGFLVSRFKIITNYRNKHLKNGVSDSISAMS